MAGKWFDRLFPTCCVLCGMSDDRAALCARCRALLPVNDTACRRCAQPLDGEAATADCGRCQSSPPAFIAARAPYHYAFPLDVALKRLKFQRRLVFAPVFGALLLPSLLRDFASCDSLVPVPLHRSRHIRRGFNQADEICRPLARASGLSVITNVIRCRATRPQSGLTAAERRANLRRAFSVGDGFQGRHPLIVDDVLTTGSTCNELAGVLLDAGAERVSVLVVARRALAKSGQTGAGVSVNV